MKKLLYFICPVFALLLLFSSCSEDDNTAGKVDFDQRAMLENYGKNLIFPAYADFNTKITALNAAVAAFVASPDEPKLAAARQALHTARLSWQQVSPFEFGPAALPEVLLKQSINTFPASRSEVDANIAAGSWDFNKMFSEDEKGFPALDYLLWGTTAQANDVIAAFTTDAQAANRKAYAAAVAQDIKNRANAVYTGWSPDGGNYLGTFISSTGNDANSSLSLLVNNMVKDFEIIKNLKLRKPLGLLSVDEQPAPLYVEAYYSGQSLELLKANIVGFERVFRGSYASGDGLGLEEYLKAHYQAGNTEEDFAATINSLLAEANVAVAAIPAPLRDAVINHKAVTTEAYNKLQAVVPTLKVNLPNTLSVSITYSDTDGD